jgi:alginate O-acetyltransferase complex protein AlgI
MTPSLLDIGFLFLLAVLIVVRRLVALRFNTLVGVVGSSLLIGLASPATLLAIAGIAVAYLYPLHRLNVVIRKRNGSTRARMLLFAFGVSGLVGLMVSFKIYQRFQLPFLDGTVLSQRALVFFGFSYFLFRAINFLYMQYLADFAEATPLPILYYCLFPATLTSGPIQKYMDFRAQLAQPAPMDLQNFLTGSYRITRGFFRKTCVAFLLDKVVISMLALANIAAWQSIVVIVSLYLFFYFDFAGYSDIAIGVGLLLGVRVPENFKRPFIATSLTEFWRNYHITLVDWMRDHIFIPLGGMRAGRLKAGLLAALVMILSGLWHGLAAPFLLWGFWHGGHMLVESMLGMRPVARSGHRGFRYWSLVLWTNTRVALGALLFLPDPHQAAVVLRGLLG